MTEPHDKNIIAEVAKITDVNMIQLGKNPQNITILDEKFDEIYLNKVHELSLSPESVKKHHDMKIIYTPLHGSGVRLVPESLKKFGFTNVKLVPEQAVIDGNFPTVESPNPEEPSTSRPRRAPIWCWPRTPIRTASALRCATRRANTCC